MLLKWSIANRIEQRVGIGARCRSESIFIAFGWLAYRAAYKLYDGEGGWGVTALKG
jgi:hypothetical protein